MFFARKGGDMHWDAKALDSVCGDLAKGFIEAHYPVELPYFPIMWERFLEERGQVSKEENAIALRKKLRITGWPFAERGDYELAAPFAILTVSAVLCELNAKGFAPEMVDIEAAIRDSAGRFGADVKLTHELAENIGPKLFDLFHNADKTQIGDIVQDDHHVIVEWWDGENVSSECDPNPNHDTLDYSEVQTKFVPATNHYQLFVDETKLLLWVGQQNRWRLLQRRHLRFLYLVLSAFGHSRKIPYESIVSIVFEDHGADRDMYRGRIRSVKSELNAKLDHVLGPYVIANKKQDLYSIQGQLPYCWIRSPSISSLLR